MEIGLIVELYIKDEFLGDKWSRKDGFQLEYTGNDQEHIREEDQKWPRGKGWWVLNLDQLVNLPMVGCLWLILIDRERNFYAKFPPLVKH